MSEFFWAPPYCPAGWTGAYLDGVIGWFCQRAQKVIPTDQICTKCGNPIDLLTRVKLQREVDFSIDGLLRLERLYRSDGYASPPGAGTPVPAFGLLWRSSYERQLVDALNSSSMHVAILDRADNQKFYFSEDVNAYLGSPDSPGTLTRLRDAQSNPIGWSYESPQGEIETYDSTGALTRIDHRDGRYVAIAHDANRRLQRVTDEHGRALQYAYDALGRVSSVLLPDGNSVTYEYNEANAITVVHLADTTTRRYGYDDPNSIFRLTSIIDEKGVTYALFTYQSNGIPLTTSHVGGVDNYQVVTDQRAAYIDPLGAQHTFTVQSVANATRVSAETKTCTGCPTLTKSISYNPTSGAVDWALDFNGNKTTYLYDPTRFVETSRTEASTDTSNPPITRITQTDWHASFRVPTERRTLNASNGLEAKTDWVYNNRGQATARCEIDPADTAAMAYTCSATTAPLVGVKVRRWVTTYCEQADVSAGTCPLVGLVTSVNGPRPAGDTGMAAGQDDVTTYTYYSTDDATCASNGACPHRHGDLWKVTNALGQITTTVSYDKNGRVTRSQDANGTTTDFTYHPRGWLLT
ncbi:DUF6531 domain-containing protein, partial [Dokdonella soli]|uniref:DUF6531 domain-containing protein n=1 Tax=Dokdonella soli TaxID=529810 RepID=UPI0031D8AC5E